jgi:hypothetical protein
MSDVGKLVKRRHQVNGCAAQKRCPSVTMLELHCPNFQALRVMLWHTVIIPAARPLGRCWHGRLRFGVPASLVH